MRHVPHRTANFQQFLHCCMCIRFHENVFTEPLPSNGRLFWLHHLSFQALEAICRHANTQRTRWSNTPFFQNKESRLKLISRNCVILYFHSVWFRIGFLWNQLFLSRWLATYQTLTGYSVSGVNVVTTFKREMQVLNTSNIFLICIWFYAMLHGVIKRHKVVWAVLSQGDKLQCRVARVRRSRPRRINLHGSSFRLLLPQEKIYIFQIALKCGGRHNLHLNIIYRLDACIFCVWNQQTGFFMANR
jgi:hypothetical protein